MKNKNIYSETHCLLSIISLTVTRNSTKNSFNNHTNLKKKEQYPVLHGEIEMSLNLPMSKELIDANRQMAIM